MNNFTVAAVCTGIQTQDLSNLKRFLNYFKKCSTSTVTDVSELCIIYVVLGCYCLVMVYCYQLLDMWHAFLLLLD
jgi:hypothetical protein